MKKILLITLAEPIGTQYWAELRDFFGDALQIDFMTCSQVVKTPAFGYDLILLSSYGFWDEIKDSINYDAKVIKIIKNLDPAGVTALEAVPYGASALVVNVGPRSAGESIHHIYGHGRTDLTLYPYYPGAERVEETDYILTQGEPQLCPPSDKPVIDIYNTVIDMQVYWDIILHTGLPQQAYGKKLAGLSKVASGTSESFSYIISERVIQDNIINALFENMNEGVLMFDAQRRVVNASPNAQRYLGESLADLQGRKLTAVLAITEAQILGQESLVLSVHGDDLICEVVEGIVVGDRELGLVVLKKFDDAQMKMKRHSDALLKKGYRAKYQLKDIAGQGDVMRRLKENVVHLAASEATILIQGESGTGKELFAHVIHENSLRRSKQFVAVNCASIPESLMESEFFGYEEGAFTGARRGGKRGIFEVASGGTLFLDEIGEIALHLQSRLLRVLQEREVSRIGGHTVIPVDVRIVAATNVDLQEQVRQGKFRRDLYYRLCVLPLFIPPLRQRGGDVLDIFGEFCRRDGCQMTLSPEVEGWFLTYPWEGNIRELRNCYEYLKYLNKSEIFMADLPNSRWNSAGNLPQSQPILPAASATQPNSLEKQLLSLIRVANGRRETIGRQKLCQMLGEQGLFLGEQEVRQHLLQLSDAGLVETKRGRGGVRITPLGLGYLSGLK